MINIDLNKAFHPRSLQLVTPLLPGLVFELSLLLMKSENARRLFARAALDRYTIVAIVLLGAFVIGAALLLWSRLIEIVMLNIYSSFFRSWPKMLDSLRRRFSQRLGVSGQPNPQQSRSFRAVMWASNKQFKREILQRDIQDAVAKTIATVLRRWGIENLKTDMTPWSFAVGRLRSEDVRSALIVLSLQATGWGGLVAYRFAPELGEPYRALCLFLVAFGLLSSSSATWHAANSTYAWSMSLDNALQELKKTPPSKDNTIPEDVHFEEKGISENK